MRDQRKYRADTLALQRELDKSVHEKNALLKQLDGTSEEIRYLRKKAGIPEDAPLEMGAFRSQVQAETAQLRALNAQLEREVAELEEERRRLRNELRFRAKWQGAHAARLGLSARQLQALEEYADALREGKRAAEKAVRFPRFRSCHGQHNPYTAPRLLLVNSGIPLSSCACGTAVASLSPSMRLLTASALRFRRARWSLFQRRLGPRGTSWRPSAWWRTLRYR